ncbi:MAG: ABC transporter permease [Firmicutes bacterium HGW-Firmicutes-1]|jgi:multiple sugar transport system permease protein|nr:MAG: ABC transporter permease [Firmicutes bacterium HGW-Firmicutes-1]
MKQNNKIAYFLILPAMFFVIIFSLWPVIQSVTYSLFDYQLNDQTKSRLSMSNQYNLELFKETNQYLNFYLDSEKSTATLTESKEKIDVLLQDINSYEEKVLNKYGEEKVVKLSDAENIEFEAFAQTVIKAINEIYTLNDEGFTIKDDVLAVTEGYASSVIKPNFIGLDNYKQAFTDARVGTALLNTLIFTFFSISIELVCGILLALIMNKAMFGRGLIRSLSLIPWAIPTVVSALIWLYLYNGTSGVVAMIFSKIGLISQPTDLLLTSTAAMGAVIIADVWKTTPYMALLLLAGLQTIPNSVYEASSVDGAHKLQQFFRITLPMLKPSILVALLFRTLDAFRVFDLIYVLTGGGPGGKTETISIYAYKAMFAQTKFGYGSALTIIIALCVAVICYFYIKVLNVDISSRE